MDAKLPALRDTGFQSLIRVTYRVACIVHHPEGYIQMDYFRSRCLSFSNISENESWNWEGGPGSGPTRGPGFHAVSQPCDSEAQALVVRDRLKCLPEVA